ncbi:PQQ-binding-like beta-propeller repeat protein [Streptomyces sp. RerS4]|uniref:outer membrane protein assembly factor BamB family protein n=1 Tax=Streptomyces sp. RerS4 TaxID=2942449 RepID=UPI00201C68B5|nr:PQQ-binding-like beta-propeller repeat protein [Streptomyces sp. RerS4]UQX02809.1 PQQ-like beta-propeller repeat protein [Streptomyces sp. RerS4]
MRAAGERVVWAAGLAVGCVEAATGAVLWRAHADEGVRARPLPQRLPDPGWVRCRADEDTVCVVVPSADGSPKRLVAREPADGRVRWWRDLPVKGVPEPVGDLVLYLAGEELVALAKEDGEAVWRQPAPPRARVRGAAGDCLLVEAGDQLLALHLSGGEPLWSWPRRYRSGVRGAPDVAAGLVHVLDGGVVRALDRVNGYQVWRFAPGAPASWPLLHDGVVYVTTYRSPAAGDLVYALDARSGAKLWERPVARRVSPGRALEPLGVRGGVLYLRSREGSRKGLLGRMAGEGRTGLPFLVGMDLASGRTSRLWERAEVASCDVVLARDTLVMALPSLTGIGLPLL